MGYFNSAILFKKQPNWSKLDALPESIGLRGYAHNEAELWLLEFWANNAAPEYPFTEGHEERVFGELMSNAVVTKLEALNKAWREVYGDSWLRLGLSVAALTDQDLFFFADDDDWFDYAYSITDGEVTALALRASMSNFVMNAFGRIEVTPGIDAEGGGEADLTQDKINTLGALSFVTIQPPKEFTSGIPLADNVLKLWPREVGEPEALLGVGTWDPFMSFNDKSEMVYERLPPVKEEPALKPKVRKIAQKSWWKFWV
ncbi:MAG: hypothetical protein AAF662_00565 [Pseudomonadota bacterium]